MGKWMRANGRDLQPIARSKAGRIAGETGTVLPGIGNVAANFGAELDHGLMHLGLDPLLQRHLAVLKNFVNVRARLRRLRINNGELFLDPKSEGVIFRAHQIQSVTASSAEIRRLSRRARSLENMNQYLVETGNTGSEHAIFLEFLDFTFAVGRPHNQRVITALIRLPIMTPE